MLRAFAAHSSDRLCLAVFPRDAMLAPVLTMALCPCLCLSICLSVCLSVCHKSVFCRNWWTDRAGFFSTGASFLPSFEACYPTLCCKGNSGIFKNKGTSLWNFAPNSGLRKFRHSRLSKGVINSARERWTLLSKLDRRRSTKLIIPPSSDARPL